MFALFWAKSAAVRRRYLMPIRRQLVGAIGIVALSALTAACIATPSAPYTGADPADPSVRVPSAHYRSTLGRYTSQRPVEPAPWREQNERVTPAPKP
jgi:hypothetical protein